MKNTLTPLLCGTPLFELPSEPSKYRKMNTMERTANAFCVLSVSVHAHKRKCRTRQFAHTRRLCAIAWLYGLYAYAHTCVHHVRVPVFDVSFLFVRLKACVQTLFACIQAVWPRSGVCACADVWIDIFHLTFGFYRAIVLLLPLGADAIWYNIARLQGKGRKPYDIIERTEEKKVQEKQRERERKYRKRARARAKSKQLKGTRMNSEDRIIFCKRFRKKNICQIWVFFFPKERYMQFENSKISPIYWHTTKNTLFDQSQSHLHPTNAPIGRLQKSCRHTMKFDIFFMCGVHCLQQRRTVHRIGDEIEAVFPCWDSLYKYVPKCNFHRHFIWIRNLFALELQWQSFGSMATTANYYSNHCINFVWKLYIPFSITCISRSFAERAESFAVASVWDGFHLNSHS